MKLPAQVKIANHIFSIEDWNKDVADAKKRYGECESDCLKIRISTAYSDSHIKEILLHEILHAIFWAYNIKDNDNEERTVTTMAIGLSQVFQDNQEIHSFF